MIFAPLVAFVHSFIWFDFFFFFFFGGAAQLVGPQFPNQGLNLGHGSECTES